MSNNNLLKIQRLNELEVLTQELVAAFPNSNPSPTTHLVYASDLMDEPIEELRVVFKRARRKYKFLPAIAEIFEELEIYRKEVIAAKIKEREEQERLDREAPGEPMPDEFKQAMQNYIQKQSMKSGAKYSYGFPVVDIPFEEVR